MKRSEMLKVIQKYIDNNVKYYYRNGVYFEEHEANDLLRELETAGMLPPDQSHCHCEDCGGPDHTWRSEDE